MVRVGDPGMRCLQESCSLSRRDPRRVRGWGGGTADQRERERHLLSGESCPPTPALQLELTPARGQLQWLARGMDSMLLAEGVGAQMESD